MINKENKHLKVFCLCMGKSSFSATFCIVSGPYLHPELENIPIIILCTIQLTVSLNKCQ